MAYAQLYETTNKKAYYLALKLLQNEDDAMDVLQDSYIAAFKSLETLQNPEAFSSWFSQIVANRSKNLLRTRNRFVKPSNNDEEETDYFENIEDTDENFLPESFVDQEEKRKLVIKMIDELPDDQRESIMLYYFSGLSTEQVAQAQECSVGTVKSRLNYARKKLKESVLMLEKKADIRLHTFVPFGLIFAGYRSDIPASIDFGQAWTEISKNIAAGIAVVGAASTAGTAGKATSTGISKAILSLSAKTKIVIGTVAAVTAAAGIAATVFSDPIVKFHSEEFETEFAYAAGLTVGEIHESDLEPIEEMEFYEGKIYIDSSCDSDESPYKKALGNPSYSWPTVDLTDLQHFKNLKSLNLDFVTIENPEALSELDLNYLAIVGSSIKSWDVVNKMNNLPKMYILLPNVSEGVLDFSNFQNLQSLTLVTSTTDSWGTEYIGFETLKNLKLLDGMAYEGSIDLSLISSMTSLQWCDLKIDSMTGLSNLSNLNNLRSLYLNYVSSGESVDFLREMPALESIGILFDSDEEYWLVDKRESDNGEMIDRHAEIRNEVRNTITTD